MVSVCDCKIKISEDQICYAGVVIETWDGWKCVLLGASFHHVFVRFVTTSNVAPPKKEGEVWRPVIDFNNSHEGPYQTFT